MIGGPGAFVIPIREREKFIEATRTKLVLEIAGRQPEAARAAGVGRSAAHLLHHRREDVAGALGRRDGFSLARLARELRDDFHVKRIAELIDRRDRGESGSRRRPEFRHRGRMSPHRRTPRPRSAPRFWPVRAPAPRRPGAADRRRRRRSLSARSQRRAGETGRAVVHRSASDRRGSGGALERLDRIGVAVSGAHARAFREPQGKSADAGKQIGDALGLAACAPARGAPASPRLPLLPAETRPAATAPGRARLATAVARAARPVRRGG